jgi:hypothetical protein
MTRRNRRLKLRAQSRADASFRRALFRPIRRSVGPPRGFPREACSETPRCSAPVVALLPTDHCWPAFHRTPSRVSRSVALRASVPFPGPLAARERLEFPSAILQLTTPTSGPFPSPVAARERLPFPSASLLPTVPTSGPFPGSFVARERLPFPSASLPSTVNRTPLRKRSLVRLESRSVVGRP